MTVFIATLSDLLVDVVVKKRLGSVASVALMIISTEIFRPCLAAGDPANVGTPKSVSAFLSVRVGSLNFRIPEYVHVEASSRGLALSYEDTNRLFATAARFGIVNRLIVHSWSEGNIPDAWCSFGRTLSDKTPRYLDPPFSVYDENNADSLGWRILEPKTNFFGRPAIFRTSVALPYKKPVVRSYTAFVALDKTVYVVFSIGRDGTEKTSMYSILEHVQNEVLSWLANSQERQEIERAWTMGCPGIGRN